jgi:hypothetical protein
VSSSSDGMVELSDAEIRSRQPGVDGAERSSRVPSTRRARSAPAQGVGARGVRVRAATADSSRP